MVITRLTVLTLARIGILLRKRDTIELIKADLVNLTEGAFHVEITSDDGGTIIDTMIEDHSNSGEILEYITRNYRDHRIVVTKVPEGWLAVFRKDSR